MKSIPNPKAHGCLGHQLHQPDVRPLFGNADGSNLTSSMMALKVHGTYRSLRNTLPQRAQRPRNISSSIYDLPAAVCISTSRKKANPVRLTLRPPRPGHRFARPHLAGPAAALTHLGYRLGIRDQAFKPAPAATVFDLPPSRQQWQQ